MSKFKFNPESKNWEIINGDGDNVLLQDILEKSGNAQLDHERSIKLQEVMLMIAGDQSGKLHLIINDILKSIESADNVQSLQALTGDISSLNAEIIMIDSIADVLRDQRDANRQKVESQENKKLLMELVEEYDNQNRSPESLVKIISAIKENPELKKSLQEKIENPSCHLKEPSAEEVKLSKQQDGVGRG